MRRPRVFTIATAAALTAMVATAGAAPAGTARAARSSAVHHPTRIVSLSPTATEMLYAMGAGGQVVAVDSFSDYPSRAPRTSLSSESPSAEAIASYRPDLVLLADNTVADQLHQLGIAVLVLPPATSLAETYRQLLAVGAATGHAPAARALQARLRSDLATIASQVPKRKVRPAVYWELDDTFFSADSSTFIGQLLKAAGLRNIADQASGAASGYPQLSAEYVVRSDPAVIFLADTICCGQSPATLAARPGFSGVAAVAHHHVVPLNDDVASRWGPRVVQLFQQIVNATKQL
jgi:iron complex transport system substrate-binding protein